VGEGRFAYVSGQGPFVAGELVRGSIEEQTTLTLTNLVEAIESAGGTKEDIVRCGCFLSDISLFPGFNQAYTAFFGDAFPARSTVGAGLPEGMHVEIDVVVALPNEER
jgi:2-iminobutanoate/2-iminopropanoate deaminase